MEMRDAREYKQMRLRSGVIRVTVLQCCEFYTLRTRHATFHSVTNIFINSTRRICFVRVCVIQYFSIVNQVFNHFPLYFPLISAILMLLSDIF